MDKHEDNHGITITGYLMGFILAALLTILSFVPVMKDLFHQWTVSSKIIYLLGLALIQIFVQVFYFLHLQHGPDAKWNLGTFGFAVVCVTIIIGGTWWAIQHLNYNMMGGSGRIVTPPLVSQAPAAPVSLVGSPENEIDPTAEPKFEAPIKPAAIIPQSGISSSKTAEPAKANLSPKPLEIHKSETVKIIAPSSEAIPGPSSLTKK